MKSVVKRTFKGKSVLLIGGAGSVGQQMILDLLKLKVSELVVLDHNETEVFHLHQKHGDKIKPFVGDVTNREFMFRMIKNMDIVINLAAMKHVHLGEISADSIVQTNIVGLQNVLDACLASNVERMVYTSSDKAVNPTNVMGTSKLMGERLVTAVHSKRKGEKTKFCSTRFGNVIGSRGGVYDIFKDQASNGSALTLTDKNMTRFIMSMPEASRLVLESISIATGGEVFVTKMPTIYIEDLARVMKERYAPAHIPHTKIPIKLIGSKPGEKLYEELLSGEEVTRSFEIENFIVVMPPFRSVFSPANRPYLKGAKKATKQYISHSENMLSKDQLRVYLQERNLLEE